MFKFTRVIVIAPTRSTCVNLHHLIGLDFIPDTLLMKECGQELDAAIADLPNGGFGIVAGTGSGKSAAIKRICAEVLGVDLKVGIVTLEHQRQPSSKEKNVFVITPGVAVQWAKSGVLRSSDLIVLDEVHQNSEHLELAMALLKRRHCKFVWMSATIDPAAYGEYLEARRVIVCDTYDPQKRASVKYGYRTDVEIYLRRQMADFVRQGRCVAVFVPTRREAEILAESLHGSGATVDFYHGGESAEKLRTFIEGEVKRPYVIFMTSAGASSLNLAGLDTVVIVDKQYTQVVKKGKRLLSVQQLDANTILQMAGRVDGRARNGQVHILTTDTGRDLRALKPVAPQFVLGGALEQLAMVSAHLGIDARELDMIGELDRVAYGRVFERLVKRGLILVKEGAPSLTSLGRRLEKLPVETAWAEVITRAQDVEDKGLLRVVCLAAACGEIYQMTKRNWRQTSRLAIMGSDHLTCHNIVAEALLQYGKLTGKTYRLNGADFEKWCKEEAVSSKAIREAALLAASIYQQLGVELPEPEEFGMVARNELLHLMFIELLAGVQSMDFVYQQSNSAVGRVYGNDLNGVTYGRAVLGSIRHWTDKGGNARASIEGTEIPEEVIARYAKREFISILNILDDGRVQASFKMVFAGELTDSRYAIVNAEEIPADALRDYRGERQWKSWDRPEVPLPDLTRDPVEIPPVIEMEYGQCPETGEPLPAYGAVKYTIGYFSSGQFEGFWTRDRDEAIRVRESAVMVLPEIAAERELMALRQSLQPLQREIEGLWRTHLYNYDLSTKVRFGLANHRELPLRGTAEELECWRQEAERFLSLLDGELEVIASRKAAELKQMAELKNDAQSLRERSVKLYEGNRETLPETLNWQLRSLNSGNDEFPVSVSALTEWISGAREIIARTERFVTDHKVTNGSVSEASLDALKARFGSVGARR